MDTEAWYKYMQEALLEYKKVLSSISSSLQIKKDQKGEESDE